MTINGKLYSNILLVFALESEAGKEFENYNKESKLIEALVSSDTPNISKAFYSLHNQAKLFSYFFL